MPHFQIPTHVTRILLGLVVFLSLNPLRAQAPVVYGVLFYSPTCRHCHEVITNHWPGIQAEFGDQLQVLFIDISIREGSQIMRAAIEAMQIESNGVPMLIIGSDVMVGSLEIPQRAPGIIRAGLDTGGIGYPPIPGMDAIFQAALSDAPSAPAEIARPSLFQSPANLAALVVLLGLVMGIGLMAAAGWRLVTRRSQRLIGRLNGLFGQRLLLAGTVVGIGLAVSLLIGSFEDPLTLLISSSVLAAFLVLALHLFRSASLEQLASWLIPLIVVAGLLVAGYLAYIEVTLLEATCGLLTGCNTVQQSPYARILGIPVGVIGIVGYLAILSLWTINWFKSSRWINGVMFVVVALGVLFSIYLTFLEPFVIGESCVWCLISAVIMGLLLWMTAPAGWNAVYQRQFADERSRKSS